ncbi:two-component system response regulator [Nocardioides sp. Root1257]|uniref:response regulator n=1 Tax=unclassified Nocardioides TaxID=2615069 RepID=UPI0006F7E5E4|nr:MULTISPECIES: response regulator [unclassified Nocardioides]KQW43888.1 two-component system response regulator [Nocardioides sp. Root1257]KRC42329.1 two-component system response regulator [Nocardioides sp. Root224]
MTELDVLVVEDDFMVASIHTRFVERVPGYRVVGVSGTGRAALEDVERLAPDLLLLDVHLPDMSGIEVLRRLRAEGNAVGVIVITAAREADTVRAAVAGGAAHYLVKPFVFEDLAARLAAFGQAQAALAGSDVPDQADIDAVFAPVGRAREELPKGLSQETADAVLAALRAGDEVGAAACAETVGISRVSARRYLEHFVATGAATVRLQYGGAGRPERRYRPTSR